MAAELTIYSIYKLRDGDSHYLLRTVRPECSNASQSDEDRAESLEKSNRERMLKTISPAVFELVGEFQDYPVGNELYAENGKAGLEIYYMETAFGNPWVILGSAASEEEFLSELNEDDDLLRLNPTGRPIKITVTFVTENDFP